MALGLRLIWAAFVQGVPVSDAYVFDQLAKNLLTYGVYGLEPDAPTAYRAVGTPAIFAAAYWVFGPGQVAVVAVNLLATIAIVLGTDWLGRQSFGALAGRLAALLVACWPGLIQFTTIVASELPFLAMCLTSIWLWDRAMGSGRSLVWVAIAALAVAGSALIKPIALLLPVVLTLTTLPAHWAAPARLLLRNGVMMVLVVLALMPWAMRNAQELGHPYLVTSNFWPNMWIGNHSGANGGYVTPPQVPNSTEVERAAILKAEVLRDISADPTLFVARLAWKAILLQRVQTIGVHWNEAGIVAQWGRPGVTLLKLTSAVWWLAALGAGCAGLALVLRQRGLRAALASPPVTLWIYFVAVHVVFLVDDRLNMPAIPAIAVLGGYALTQWRHILQVDWQRMRQDTAGVS